jgi:hypothetical protein
MARPLAALERFLERLVERPIGRLFRTPLEPVQVERRLGLAMDEGRRAGEGRTLAPDRYRVQLHADDLAALLRGDPTLEARFAAALLARARAHGYTLLDRPRVTLHANRAVPRGDVAVTAAIVDASIAGAGGVARSGPVADGAGAAVEVTAAFPVPAPALARAALVVGAPGRPDRRTSIEVTPIRIGRAADNDLVLPDERVSRHHGLLLRRHGALVYRDLGSANGSFLGTARVAEVALGPGDVLRLGETTLRVEAG